MLDTPSLSAIASAIASLQRHPGSDQPASGAVVLSATPDRGHYALEAAVAIAGALGYDVISHDDTHGSHPWVKPGSGDTPGHRWGRTLAAAIERGRPALLVVRAPLGGRMTPTDFADFVTASLALPGGHGVVVVEDRTGDQPEERPGGLASDLVEAVCDAVIAVSRTRPGREGVETVDV